MVHFQKNLSAVNEKMGQVVHMSNAQLALMKTLAYKSIDQDARSRRNNLVFRGIAENFGENCLQLIYDFLRNRLNIAGDVYIDRAHRIFKRNQNRHRQIRPIVVKFRDYRDIERIMSNVRLLKGTSFSVDHDYPPEIQEARSRLWPRYKELRAAMPRSKTQIVYPAKLIQDGRIVADVLPEWSNHIRASRLSHLENINKLRTQPHNLLGPSVSQQVLTPFPTDASQQEQIVMQPNTNNHHSNVPPPGLSHTSLQQQMETQPDTCTDNHVSNVPPLLLSGKSPSHTNTSQQ